MDKAALPVLAVTDCPVCGLRAAVRVYGVGEFHPCGRCELLGWSLIRRRTRLGRWLGRFRNI